ncbi:hypothetical protein Cgig2_011056 [Carnegiea gigantea]|uniref:Uncharacterized protein n=1 Tax=Carnegiea gigantea TaxID=171969 RepID=A0A9Q1GID4_9CARY|nr:hypothetical protein Cgig2_011056 [Carnegiea gigantea]
MATEFSKLGSVQRSDQGRVPELVNRKRARRWSRRMRAQPLRGRPPLGMVTSGGEAVRPMNAWPTSASDILRHAVERGVELDVVHGFMAEGLKSTLVGLGWSSFEVWMSYVDHELREVHLQWSAIEMEVRGPLDGQEESSGSNDPPAPSNDEE